jgi:hypothetical protein
MNASAQQDYKLVYEAIKNMKDYEAFQTLFNYQAATTSKDYANANGYYQLGLISQKMMRQYDPFLQPENVSQCISGAKTYFSLAGHYLDAKEAKKNSAYYQATPEPRTFENIKKDIADRTDDVMEYKKYFDRSQEYLKSAIYKYNACLETFAGINAQNSRLNDLYFLVDGELKKNLENLRNSFDSTVHYLDLLKHSLEEYPLGDYKISYSLMPVPVYRLHGLTSSSFIAKNITLWDFRSWLDSFNEVLNTDVAFLYRKAEEVHGKNLDCIAKLLRNDKTGIPRDYTVDPLVINKIYKYDFNSVVAPLLKYQEEKIKFLYHRADNVIDARLDSPDIYAKSNTYYFDLIAKKQAVDSALALTSARTAPEAVKKYSAFFAANYKDFAGFQSYLKNEAAANSRDLHEALDGYANSILKPLVAATVPCKDGNLYTSIVTPDKTGEAGYFIHAKSVTPDRKVFITGSYANSSETQAFAALLNQVGDIEWLRLFDKTEGKSHGVLAAHSDNGYIAVVSTDKGTATGNVICLLDAAGNVKKSLDLETAAVPRKLIYDDISETYLIAFKGNSYQPFAVSGDLLHVCLLDSGLKTVWNSTLQFTGYIAGLIRTNNRFYIYGAYSEIVDAGGKVYATDGGKISLFVSTVDAAGNQVALKTFDTPFSCYPLLVSKISNEYVDVICVKDRPEFTGAKDVSYYLIISSDNEVYYRSE